MTQVLSLIVILICHRQKFTNFFFVYNLSKGERMMKFVAFHSWFWVRYLNFQRPQNVDFSRCSSLIEDMKVHKHHSLKRATMFWRIPLNMPKLPLKKHDNLCNNSLCSKHKNENKLAFFNCFQLYLRTTGTTMKRKSLIQKHILDDNEDKQN